MPEMREVGEAKQHDSNDERPQEVDHSLILLTSKELEKLESEGKVQTGIKHFQLTCHCAGQCSHVKFTGFLYKTQNGTYFSPDDFDVEFVLDMGSVWHWTSLWVKIKMALSLLWRGYVSFCPIGVTTKELVKFREALKALASCKDEDDEL